MMQQETERRLTSTNKRNAPRLANANSRVRQSPIVKPGRRKATVSSLLTSPVLEAKERDIVDILLDQWTNPPVDDVRPLDAETLLSGPSISCT
jgi:hypothetical protein